MSARCSVRWKLPSFRRRTTPSAPNTAISIAISAMRWASVRASASSSKTATSNAKFSEATLQSRTALGRGFQFGIEVGDHVLACGDSLLERGDLHQFPAAHRGVAVLQTDNQVAPLFLELNKR